VHDLSESLSPSFRRAEFVSPGIELWTTHVPRSYEVALLFLLLGAFLQLQVANESGFEYRFDAIWPHLGLSLTLIIPASIPMLVYGLMQLFHLLYQNLESKIPNPKPRRFVELAYGYLPLVLKPSPLFVPGLGEAGCILPVSLATFGFSGQGPPGCRSPGCHCFCRERR